MTQERKAYISTPEAARRAEVSEAAIRLWIGRYGIGRKVVGRYRVDPEALDRLIKSESRRT